ncbi:MAG TPA: HD domain-containing protein, partial [Nitrospirae bacterium]|nr:HD domain-containing protein [Nitrospirota bacterium]
TKSDHIVWDAIEKNKPQVFCDIKNSPHNNTFKKMKAIIACPMAGKKKSLGAIVIGEKSSGEEFYSSDTKFLMAISSQAALAIENAYLHQELEGFFFGTVMAFVKAIESRSHWTSGHSERVTRYAAAIAREMGMDSEFRDRLKICALLHDIGKIATPVELLDKRETLENDELTEIEQHPLTGATILGELKPFKDITNGIRYHHEKWDGNGVHEKLKGEAIPLMARIIAVADAFDAMMSDRPYRKKLPADRATKEIQINSGTQFDPDVVAAFMNVKNTLLS